MLHGKHITVVVPAYNEARLIARTVRGVPDFVDRIVVVDDASEDGTSEAARAALGARGTLLRLGENGGVGAALRVGFAEAIRQGTDIAAVMAGDGQMDPDDLQGLLRPLTEGRADFVKGNRFLDPGVRRAMPWTRYVGNVALSWLTRVSTGLRIGDSQCGYIALTAPCVAALGMESLWPRYGYPNDLLARVARAGIRLEEVRVRAVYGDETSGVRLRDALWVVPSVIVRAALAGRSHALGPRVPHALPVRRAS